MSVYFGYDWPGECTAWHNWALCSWNFFNSDPNFLPREWGFRIFGLAITNYEERS